MELKEEIVKKIIEMPEEQVLKVLIFMAGMEAEHAIEKESHRNEALHIKNLGGEK